MVLCALSIFAIVAYDRVAADAQFAADLAQVRVWLFLSSLHRIPMTEQTAAVLGSGE